GFALLLLPMSRHSSALLLALLDGHAAALEAATPPAGAPQPPPRFSFVAVGCMPYGKQNFVAYDRLLEEINRYSPAFTVHCGDTKGGAEPPSEAFLLQVKDWFNSLNCPVIYTPGDNEWTDVNRVNNGAQDPL